MRNCLTFFVPHGAFTVNLYNRMIGSQMGKPARNEHCIRRRLVGCVCQAVHLHAYPAGTGVHLVPRSPDCVFTGYANLHMPIPGLSCLSWSTMQEAGGS